MILSIPKVFLNHPFVQNHNAHLFSVKDIESVTFKGDDNNEIVHGKKN